MKLIFAVDKNWAIGLKGDMLCHISLDLKRFKKITSGNIIVMGRKTFESLPGSKPLKNRINIVVTRDKSYQGQGAILAHSLEELDSILQEINKDREKEVFLIGGAILVDSLIDKCNYAYITKINYSFPEYDTVLYNLDEDKNWRQVNQSEIFTEDKFEYSYVEYERVR